MDKIVKATRKTFAGRLAAAALVIMLAVAGTAIATMGDGKSAPASATVTPVDSVQVDLSALQNVDVAALATVDTASTGAIGGAAGGGGGGAAGGGGADVLVAQY